MPPNPLIGDDTVSHPLTESQYTDDEQRLRIFNACADAWERQHPNVRWRHTYRVTNSAGSTVLGYVLTIFAA